MSTFLSTVLHSQERSECNLFLEKIWETAHGLQQQMLGDFFTNLLKSFCSAAEKLSCLRMKRVRASIGIAWEEGLYSPD